jgi:hypothetical protein
MNNIENITSHASKSAYNKPLIIELYARAGTQGMTLNGMGVLKDLIGVEGMGGMDSVS